jgi:Tfp pilus assembly protein PilZ
MYNEQPEQNGVDQMDAKGSIIGESKEIKEILKACSSGRIVFEATDDQENLFSLGLEEVADFSPSGNRLSPDEDAPLKALFRLLQTGAAEMRLHCNYAFCFRHLDVLYSVKGKLIDADPNKFMLSYLLEKRLYRHDVRRSFRMTLSGPDPVFVEIGNKRYRLLNLSLGGVGIFVKEPDLFRIGEEVPVRLLSQDWIFEAFGSVRHIAPLTESGHICGLSLTYKDEKSLDHIRKFIDEIRRTHMLLYRMNLLLR